MRSAAPLTKISTHDLIYTDLESSQFSLWSTFPSSPPFHSPPLSEQPSDSSTLISTSPSTEFEFDSLFSLQIKDDPPVSPKLITSSVITPSFWGAAATAPTTAANIPSFDLLPPVLTTQEIPPPLLSHPITPIQQPSAPPSPSVRQLVAEEMRVKHDDDLHLDFYSAPSTPLRTPPRKSYLKQRPLSQDEPFLSIGTHAERRKSSSAMSDNQAYDELAQLQYKNQGLQSSKSEHGLSTSSSAWEKNEELEKSGAVQKQGSKISMKWAFKDFLRKTVPSSNADAHYITNIMGAGSSKKYLPSTKSNTNLSPMHSTSYMSTPQTSQPSTPRRYSMPSSSSPARSPLRHPPLPGRPSSQTLNRSRMPSPPRSPLASHAIHYQQSKAQSVELSRKTFLPYRQSLLGCLGGAGAFPPEQQAW